MSVATVLGPIGNLTEHALLYAQAGLEIFPVNPNDKTPIVSQYKATTDLDQIGEWWRIHPTALIGHRISPDQVILDIDPRHGGKDTWNAIRAELGGTTFPNTRGHMSGRGDGGGHTWWLNPGIRLSVTNLDAWAQQRQLGHPVLHKDGTPTGRWSSGIDLLHHGHRYTILPPSPHPDTGQPYRWIDGRGLNTPPGIMPALLVDLVTDDTPYTPPTPPRPPDPDSIADWYTTTYTWSDLLRAHGWTLRGGDGDCDRSRWRHPTATSAFSATIRYGCLFVYSPNTPFEVTAPSTPQGYTLFRAYATLEHRGDLQSASRAARELRDGPQRPTTALTPWEPSTPPDTPLEAPQTALDKLRAALLTTAAIRNLPPPDHLIASYLNRNSLATLYGPSGGGKTFLALDWALHITTGSLWHGCDTKPGPVLYIIAEGATGIGRRLDAWQTHHKIPQLDDFASITWIPHAVNLAAILDIDAVRTIATELEPTLIIVDTLARCTVGAEENSAKDMGIVIANLDTIRRATGACVLTIHHTGKDLSNGARGSSALRAAMDTEIELIGGDTMAVRVTKQKDGPEPKPLWLARKPAADSLVLVPASEAPIAEGLPPSALEALEALRQIQTPGGVSNGDWRAAAGLQDRTFLRARSKLLEAGLVANLGTDKRPLYKFAMDIESDTF